MRVGEGKAKKRELGIGGMCDTFSGEETHICSTESLCHKDCTFLRGIISREWGMSGKEV